MKLIQFLKREWLQILILAVPFIAAALVWDQLPDRVPNHWNIRGEVDGYAGKIFGTLFLPILTIGMMILFAFIPRLDPKCRNYDDETKASIARVFRICRLAISLFMTVLALTILAFALHWHVNVCRVIVAGLGMLFIVMGNSMGKLRPNYFAGFRTPWTLESKTVWLKTHRLGGFLMVLSGLLLIVEDGFLTFFQIFFAGLIPLIVLVGFVPLIYSYILHRAEIKNSGPAH